MLDYYELSTIYATELTPKIELLKQYHFESVETSSSVTIPHIIGLDNPQIEEEINQLITQSIQQYLNQFKESNNTYTNINDPLIKKWIVDINYQVYFIDSSLASFSINATQIKASSYLQKTFFNIDLKTARQLTVEDFLGKKYSQIIQTEIQKQIKENKKNLEYSYFDDVIQNLNIQKEQPFYINQQNQVVVVFNEFD
ncbi:MAG: PdaC/SigV domain-containing protein, partial [Coprobacillus cateniformis]